MLDDHGFEKFEHANYPLAYLITIRTYGTWLHGDERWSVGRTPQNRYGAKLIPPNVPLKEKMKTEMRSEPFKLDPQGQIIVKEAITSVCVNRKYRLSALNVRPSHAHILLSSQAAPERITSTLKAHSTRRLRESGMIDSDTQVWSRGGSNRYLWKPQHVADAIDYVLYCQEDIPFDFRI